MTEFDTYAARGNELLGMLSEELEVTTTKALRILRCVLHVIRDHLSTAESLQLIAQLPIIVKGIYVEQWNTQTKKQRLHSLTEFLNEIRDYDDKLAEYDFGTAAATEKIVKAVFKTLHFYISDGEFEDLIAALPVPLKKFISDSIGKGNITM